MATRPHTFIKGDRAEYTGTVQILHGGTFYTVEMMEGADAGKLRLTQRGPDGSDPYAEQHKSDWTEAQRQFRRLHENPKRAPYRYTGGKKSSPTPYRDAGPCDQCGRPGAWVGGGGAVAEVVACERCKKEAERLAEEDPNVEGFVWERIDARPNPSAPSRKVSCVCKSPEMEGECRSCALGRGKCSCELCTGKMTYAEALDAYGKSGKPTRSNPHLIIVGANPPPPAALEAAWCRFHQRDRYDGKTVDLGSLRGAPAYSFALGRLHDIEFGGRVQVIDPRPWIVCNPSDDSLWIISRTPIDARHAAGLAVQRVTYDPTEESGKEPALYRHRFDAPRPTLAPVGNPAKCHAILLDGGKYRVTDWIHD